MIDNIQFTVRNGVLYNDEHQLRISSYVELIDKEIHYVVYDDKTNNRIYIPNLLDIEEVIKEYVTARNYFEQVTFNEFMKNVRVVNKAVHYIYNNESYNVEGFINLSRFGKVLLAEKER